MPVETENKRQPIHPLILSGGSGSRLWPVSRHSRPKQFLSLGGSSSMIVDTARRTSGGRFAPPTIVCNVDHRFLIAESFREAGIAPRKILLEPAARNTAAAIAAGVLSIAGEGDPLVLAMPSDHIILDAEAFRAAIEAAAPAALEGRVVTFGIKPSRAETGYGYIEQGPPLDGVAGVHTIMRFHEKPKADAAERYLASGRFSWNAGIFFFRASAVIEALQRSAPDILDHAREALAASSADMDFTRLDAAAFEKIPAQPFDIAVMEKTDRGAVVPVDMGWSDIGSWRSLWEISPKDAQGNATVGDALLLDSSGSMAWSGEGTLTALVGVRDLVVVASDDAVLVAGKDHAEKVKDLVDLFKKQGRKVHLDSPTIYRPWGNYTLLDSGNGYLVKRIVVYPGGTLSLQYHNHRAEHWVVVEGEATVTHGERIFTLKPNESTYIPIGDVHRIENRGAKPLRLIEVQSGALLSEDDIVRLEDRYGRRDADAPARESVK